jgi:phosphoglycerate kinase
MKLKPIKENIKKIEGRRVFLRVDFNVPLKGGKIQDETKIIAALPAIRFLLRYKCKIILATHLGEPSGKKINNLSVRPVYRRLSALLGTSRIKFVGEIIGKKVDDAFKKIKGGEILMLENLRFDPGEEKNDKKFAKALAKNCEVYVNEAFSVCHRAHASVSAIRKYLPSFAGLLLENEIANLDKAKKLAKPLVLVMGGAKIHTKINLIKNLESHTGHILIGGAIANNFFKALGLSVGKSLIDKESVLIAKKLLRDKKIVLPYDVVVANKKTIAVRMADQVRKDDIIYDIGPRTINLYSRIIKDAKTIIWNGPLGAFEKPHFRHGTVALGQVIAAHSRGRTFGLVGGGETLEALKLTKMERYVDWISTGGGAMLAYLGGEHMPGLE